MSTQTDSANGQKKMTIDDPIDAETLAKFGEIQNARMRVSEQVVDLEQEKIRLLVSVRQLDQEKQRLFEKVLTDRGISPTTPVEIDSKTGKISPVKIPDGMDVQVPQPS